MLKKKLNVKKIKSLFNFVSFFYDLLNSILTFGVDYYFRNKIKNYLNISNNDNLLDLACGTSESIICNIKNINKIRYNIGVDLSKNMIKISKKKIYDYFFFFSIYFKLLDIIKKKIKTKFNNITISFGIRNIMPLFKIFKILKNKLLFKGRLIILEFSLPKNFFIRFIYLFYIRYFIPFLGYLFSSDSFAYLYLVRSMESFCIDDKLLFIFKKSGFNKNKLNKFIFGLINIYVGIK